MGNIQYPPKEADGMLAYVFQPNAISQSIHALSPYAKKLTALALALIPDNGNFYAYCISFSVKNFIDSFGLSDGTETREQIKNALCECATSTLELSTPSGGWIAITWFSCIHWKSKEEEKDDNEIDIFLPTEKILPTFFKSSSTKHANSLTLGDTIEITFNPILTSALRYYKKAYAKLSLLNFGKLKSRYSIRYYEIAMSYAGFAGKNGNPKDTWYFKNTLKELRMLFKIEKHKYKATGNFRTFIIDNPIKELNEAKIGIKITPKYIREGKFLVGVEFICEYVNVKPKKEAKKAIEAKETPISGKREDISAEIEELRGKYPAEWEKIYEEETQKFTARMVYKESKELMSAEEKIIEGLAFGRLKEHLGL